MIGYGTIALQDIMYLRTLKAARSAKFFWEEIFMPKSQLGGILYIFPPGTIIKKKTIQQAISPQFLRFLEIICDLSIDRGSIC